MFQRMIHHRCPSRRPIRPILATAALLALTACAGAASPPSVSTTPRPSPVTTADFLAYDASVDPDFRQDAAPQVRADGVTVTDVSYASSYGRVSAWLVEPPASVQGPHAGLVYLHGSETNRDDLLDEAVAMAHAGAVSLVLDAPFARGEGSIRPYLQSYVEPDKERDMTAQAGVDIRRAFDVLAARPDVDPHRLAFVGHSWGASLGAVVASVDHRARAWALLSPRPSWTGFLESNDPFAVSKREAYAKYWDAYIRTMQPFDALPVIGSVDGPSLLLQYGNDDDVVPPKVARQLITAAPAGTTTQRFDAGHALDAEATRARCSWVSDRLGLPRVDSATLANVGLPDE